MRDVVRLMMEERGRVGMAEWSRDSDS
jgi:hypothetical protein